MSTIMLALRQARYDNRAFWRNPAAAFFTFFFPLMFLVIFNVAFGDEPLELDRGNVDPSSFFVPGIVAFSVINACYSSIAQLVAFSRDRGLLKRVRGTPLPTSAFLAGRVLQAVVVAVVLVVVVVTVGALFYGVEVPGERLPAFAFTLAVGAAVFCALGLAVSGLIPNADASPAVVNASILPLLFISDVWIPMDNAPDWLRDFASLFPVVHFANGLHASFDPFATGSGFEAKSLAVLGAWGVAGVVVALRFFSWEPRR